MTTATGLDSVLAEAGLRVDAREFVRLVADAARRIAPPHSTPSDYFSEEQQRVLTDVGLDLRDAQEGESDPRARSVATATAFAETSYSVAEAAQRLGVDTSRIRHRLKEGKLLGWKERGWRLPAWQFTERGTLPGLEIVLRNVPDDQPQLVVAAFMTTPQSDLELHGKPVTPRDWLLAHGDPLRVAELIAALGTAA
jgi:hypothetical protein